jgi:hypothetical protein
MKSLPTFALFSIATLLLPGAAIARVKNERNVQLPDPVQVAGKHLDAGSYKLEWKQSGPGIEVTFLKNNKAVATSPATLKTNDPQVVQDSVMTHQSAKNKRVLDEIDFSNDKEALVFAHGHRGRG